MAGYKVNIFYLIAFICSILLIGYAWFIFLPTFEDIPAYSSVKNIVILLTVLLVITSSIQILLSIKKEKPEKENNLGIEN